MNLLGELWVLWLSAERTDRSLSSYTHKSKKGISQIANDIAPLLSFIIHQIFSLARSWSKRVTWANIPQLKLGIFEDIPQFLKPMDYKHNSQPRSQGFSPPRRGRAEGRRAEKIRRAEKSPGNEVAQ